ncbi:MAG: TonB-dependent receptor, partial [Chitinophagales bacterium]|nr:TonB-dependent receptor [Chitinophagales bacterium]
MKPIYLLLFSVISLSAFAQDINVRGRVLDAITNEGIIGATIKIKDGTTGAVTDVNGNFSLMSVKGSTLEVSAVGYKAAEVAAQSSVSILLSSSVNDLSNVTVIGTRDVNRSVANSPVPIDIINLKTATKLSPQLDLNQMLTYLEPSFNSVRQSSSDGTEHIDPASLRGLGPDQTLVLINGKRRHNTSLLNNQGTFGNGSVGTDLNTIPSSAIDHIEILRDGASAQYGSDAIAGVINIVLKKNTNTLNAGLSGGITSLGDGATSALNLNWGGNLGKNGGFLNLTGEVYYRGKTSRTQNHNLIIFDQSALGNYFAYAFANDSAISRAYDDSVLASQNLTRDDFNFQVGDAQIKNGSAFYNLSLPSSNGRMEFYSFGGFSYRDGDGFGFRRLPSEYENMVYSIFPNGFQPNTGSHIYDESFAAGLRLKTGEWNWDISNTLGDNRFDFFVNNTVNASMQGASPTSFSAGGHEFLQNTTNIDLDRNFKNVLKGFNLAFGGEFRYEQYQIREGEEASWKNFGLTTLPDGTVEDTLGLAGGSQSFPGFQPYNAGKHSRTNGALYVDGALQITDKWLIDAAARFENYSDFGSAVSGK